MKCKAVISNLDWSIDSRLVCASFKNENLIVVWNINTCQKVFTFNAKDHTFGSINKALFYNLNPDYLLISGDKAIIFQISTNKKVVVAEETTILPS